MNFSDFVNNGNDESPMIQVQGIGQMKLSQAKRRVQGMLHELVEHVDSLVIAPEADLLQWKGVKTLIDRGTLQAYINAIVEATGKQH